ncbi:helix-turn-helix transcriptional regulator [Burkholderia sp. Ac-20353]|uniref:helix-turn-helix domain-containing protein n=1 Tax=Burkholderia sp. Ac-20353 TaxID=2703894 RepID=UPI00197C0BED|nr:helix-turn-helix transcriptional regulator [Burkholderia sp. Ac-20353]MBN3790566.1 helix-turn-helix transcriptional regulator [Burkholderia sp. Ac-20353]
MEFAQRLKNLRKARGLTQLDLADAIGLGVLQIRRYEGGSAYPSLNACRYTHRDRRIAAAKEHVYFQWHRAALVNCRRIASTFRF